MKSFGLILIVAALSAVCGAFASRLFETSTETPPLALDMTDRMTDVDRRVADLEDELVVMRRKMVTRESLDRMQLGTQAISAESDVVAALRTEIEELRAQVKSGAVTSPDGTDIVTVIDDRISRAAQDRKERNDLRARQKQQTSARRRAERRVRDYTKRLDLDTSQAARLTTALAERSEAIWPHYGTLKNSDSSPDDIRSAIAGIRAGRSTFEDDARSHLDSNQFEQLLEMEDKETTRIDTWITEVEESLETRGR